MINWNTVFFNSLWIFGLAIVLAGYSHQYWLTRERGWRLREALARNSWIRIYSLGLILFCLSWAVSNDCWWEQVIWAVLGLSFVWQVWMTFRKRKPS